MSKNSITGDNIITKSSSTYADNFDAIFRNKKVYYSIEYYDRFVDNFKEFNSETEAQQFFEANKDAILVYEKQELLQE